MTHKNIFITYCILAILIAMSISFKPCHAEFIDGESKILPNDGVANDHFAKSVSVSGDYAIVGSPKDDDNGSNSGSAYIFKRNSNASWTRQAKLTPNDGASGDEFGTSVSLSGDYAIVGSVWDDDNGDNSGSAYIFRRSGETWIQQAKLTPNDGASGDEFANSVSLSGDFAIVGCVRDDDYGDDSGSAYIFRRSGETWVQQAKLTPTGWAEYCQFGCSVSISGDYAIVGAAGYELWGEPSGSIYFFKRSNDIWLQQAKLTSDDIEVFDEFGKSVSISGNYAIVGSPSDDDKGGNSGSAYIFRRSGETWVQQAKLIPDEDAPGGRFGISAAMSGDYAIVGAYLDDNNEAASGSTYIFIRSGETWIQYAKLTPDDGAEKDYFGWSVSMSGDNLIVGAHGNDDNEDCSGSAYTYHIPIPYKIIPNDGASGGGFGNSVSLSTYPIVF